MQGDFILEAAMQYRQEADEKSRGHEVSAESHRKMGVRLTLLSTVLSSLVASAVFTALVSKFGLDAKGALTIPPDVASRALFYAVVATSLLSPIVSGWNVYSNDAGQSTKHTESYAEYAQLKRKVDQFLAKYRSGENRSDAQAELAQISDEMARLDKGAIPLADAALEKAGVSPERMRRARSAS